MKVLIVGGAEYSADVSEFDKVVAINDHHPEMNNRFKCEGVYLKYGHVRNKPFIGLDLVGTCELYRELSPLYTMSGESIIREFEWANIFRKQYRMKPFTGMYALEYFRLNPVDSIHLDGMTFYHERGEDGKFKRLENFKRDSHDILQNIRYLQEVKRIDARVTFSGELEEVLALYY
jgi:hypothetical protein